MLKQEIFKIQVEVKETSKKPKQIKELHRQKDTEPSMSYK